MMADKKIRVLIAKAGLDGHDVGAKVVARALLDAGFDVTYTGLRKSPEEIARQAQEIRAGVIGLSLLSGSHLPICRQFSALRSQYGIAEVPWLVGGVIPEEDFAALKELGVDAVFPVGTPLEWIIKFIRERAL